MEIFIAKRSGKLGDVAPEKDGWGPGGDGRLLHWGGGRGGLSDVENDDELQGTFEFTRLLWILLSYDKDLLKREGLAPQSRSQVETGVGNSYRSCFSLYQVKRSPKKCYNN